MSEFFKESIRLLLFPIAVALGGEFHAEEGTALFYFLTWLYGEDAREEE